VCPPSRAALLKLKKRPTRDRFLKEAREGGKRQGRQFKTPFTRNDCIREVENDGRVEVMGSTASFVAAYRATAKPNFPDLPVRFFKSVNSNKGSSLEVL
jgi:hypothetical protein